MVQQIKKLMMLFFVATTMLTFASCNKDDDNGDDSGTELRLQEHVDFIDISGCNALWIENQWFSFHNVSGWSIPYTGEIANVGKVNGLSSINEIPANGWATSAPVVKGNGHVVRWTHIYGSCIYYRIYVKDLITDSAGKFLGAVIRYDRWDLFD